MNDNVEINYDQDGVEKSVVVPYSLWVEMLSAKEAFDDLKNTLNQVYFILSNAVGQSPPSESVELTSGEDFELIAEIESPTPEPLDRPIANENRDIRYYQSARGYYVDSKQFCVLAGSKARENPSQTFNSRAMSDVRKQLISAQVLARQHDWQDYEFTRDYVFPSPSLAASVVDGNSRSGPEAWGRPRFSAERGRVS